MYPDVLQSRVCTVDPHSSVLFHFIMSCVDRLNVSILLELAFQLLLKGSTLLYVRLELKSTNTPSIVASSCKQKSS